MKIGLLLPSVFMYDRISKGKIFAPKDLFISLANGLVKRGHNVRVYSSEDTKTLGTLVPGSTHLALEEPPLMKIRYIKSDVKTLYARRDARWAYDIDLTAHAYEDGRMKKVDIIHSFLEFTSHYFAEASGVPSVFTIHDPVPDEGSLDWWQFKRFSKDHYVAISKNQAKHLSTVMPIGDVVYNGIDMSLYPFEEKEGEYLLFAGRFMPEKGLDDAVEVALRTKTPTIIAGSKEYRAISYYREKIEPKLSNPLFKSVGLLTDKAKGNLFRKAKALLFPIKWEEPFGMVMIEAMASGTPVIAYNRGSVSEVVRDGVTGFVVDPKRGVDGLVEAVGKIGKIDRAACRKHVEENFTVDRMVDGYEKAYKKILNH